MIVYAVEFSPQATRFFRKLPKDIQERIKNKFKEVAEEPFHYLEHYEGADSYKLRIGDYRALIDVDFENKILLVRVLDLRGRIYKR